MSQFKLSSKGQVTIPLEIRQFLRLEPGDAVRFDVKDGKVLLMPQSPDRLEALKKLQTAYQKKQGKKKASDQNELRGWDKQDEKIFANWEKEQKHK
jgi:AbrB family looped-hinge helix DNA binding protein